MTGSALKFLGVSLCLHWSPQTPWGHCGVFAFHDTAVILTVEITCMMHQIVFFLIPAQSLSQSLSVVLQTLWGFYLSSSKRGCRSESPASLTFLFWWSLVSSLEFHSLKKKRDLLLPNILHVIEEEFVIPSSSYTLLHLSLFSIAVV